jgi:octaheme c-type cytochrome (tetrathionate reductase family)
MCARLSAAVRAVFPSVFLFAVGLLLFPLITPAAELATFEKGEVKAYEKLNPMTPEQFIEYASIKDENIHELYFGTILYEGTESCLLCHADQGEAALEMGHFKWEGRTDRIVGLEGQVHGKNDMLNNFCVSVPSNEARCTQCHIGYGYKDSDYNFDDPANVDCLVCHDQTGTYAKAPTTAGLPLPTVDLNAVAQSVAAKPQIMNCLRCHANAGGGDNVKHGDLAMSLNNTTREYDVHMGKDGAGLVCVDCHGANHNPDDGSVNHGNAGMSLHSVNEGEMKQCTDCHGSRQAVHADTPAGDFLFGEDWHDRLACQVCHIPAIARQTSTKVEWYWADAGKDLPANPDPETNRPTFDKKKGSFVWATNVRPELRYANGKWERRIINATDVFDEEPVQMAVPQGDHSDANAMIYPFKLMKGNQPVDANNNTILVPHLFGTSSGPNPFWGKWDWNLALQEGANYVGQTYSGEYRFADTEMLMSVNHEVAPAEDALGAGAMPDGCLDCHTTGVIDFEALGWSGDPLQGGERQATVEGGMGILPDNGTGVE